MPQWQYAELQVEVRDSSFKFLQIQEARLGGAGDQQPLKFGSVFLHPSTPSLSIRSCHSGRCLCDSDGMIVGRDDRSP